MFNGRPWAVKFVPAEHEALGKKAVGMTSFDTSTIFLQSDLSPHYRLTTFWHEMTHVFTEAWRATEKSKIHQELACDLVGLGMTQLLMIRHTLPDWPFQPPILPNASQRRLPKKPRTKA